MTCTRIVCKKCGGKVNRKMSGWPTTYAGRVNVERCDSQYRWLQSDQSWMNYTHSLCHDSNAALCNLSWCVRDKTVSHYESVLHKITTGINIHNALEKRNALLALFRDLMLYLRNRQYKYVCANCGPITAADTALNPDKEPEKK